MRRICLALGLLLLVSGCGRGRRGSADPPTERQRRIARLQEFSREAGAPHTGNFERTDAQKTAYYLCYSTGPFTLPEDYNGLRYKESDERGCRIDTKKHDVYFHRVEAVAMVNTPVTRSLEEATEERALMVVAHEELHEDPQIERLPAAAAESATTLLGILTAAEFARHEGDIRTATHLFEDARTFSRKAEAVNALHTKLRALYAEERTRKRRREETAAVKARLFAEHAAACKSFGHAHSINPCLSASNNAGLAFDHTYTRIYPLLYELFEARSYDPAAFRHDLRGLADAVAREGKRGREIHRVEQRIRGLISVAISGQ